MQADLPYIATIFGNPGEDWDRIAASFSDVNLMQTAAYATGRWGGRAVGLALRDGSSGEYVSASLAVVAKTPILAAGLAAVKFGPLWRKPGVQPDLRILDAGLAALRREFVEKRRLLLRVMPPPDPEHSDAVAGRLAASGFAHRTPPGHLDRYLVFLRPDDAELRSSLSAGWRRHLRKAEGQGLEVAEISGAEALTTFHRLYAGMVARKRFSDTHAVQALAGLLAPGAEAAGIRVLVATHAGEAQAITVLAGRGDVVSVPFSATSDRALELQAGYLLRWRAMRLLRDAGASWLDLGGDEGDEGLRSFKSGNVGKHGKIVKLAGDFDLCRNPASRTAVQFAELGKRLSRLPIFGRSSGVKVQSA